MSAENVNRLQNGVAMRTVCRQEILCLYIYYALDLLCTVKGQGHRGVGYCGGLPHSLFLFENCNQKVMYKVTRRQMRRH